jgi:hypothetical protein
MRQMGAARLMATYPTIGGSITSGKKTGFPLMAGREVTFGFLAGAAGRAGVLPFPELYLAFNHIPDSTLPGTAGS